MLRPETPQEEPAESGDPLPPLGKVTLHLSAREDRAPAVGSSLGPACSISLPEEWGRQHMGISFRALGREVEPRRRPSGVSALPGARFRRAMVIVLVLGTFLAACGSEEGASSPDARTETSAQGEPDPVLASPSIEGDTPDQRFETWLETGGPEVELYEHWVAGQLPGEAPSADASDQELEAQFDRWVQSHLRLIRGAWDRAQDKGAQADLRNGLAVALVFAVDQDSFEGLTPREARSIDPGSSFNDGETVVGEVSIRQANATAVLLTTESASGAVFCAVHLIVGSRPVDEFFGTTDAHRVADCSGGWPE